MVLINEKHDEGIEEKNVSSNNLPWYHSHALWSNMMTKTFDERYKSHGNFLDAHPAITAKMRSVLCDWLIEVDELSNGLFFFVHESNEFLGL